MLTKKFLKAKFDCILNEELPCDWLKDEQQVDEQLIIGCHLVAVQCNIYSNESNAGFGPFLISACRMVKFLSIGRILKSLNRNSNSDWTLNDVREEFLLRPPG